MLDPGLSRIYSLPIERMPLALRRFSKYVGEESVVRAMERSARRLLDAYRSKFGMKSAISVSWLCDLCRVRLLWNPARRRDSGVYSLAGNAGGFEGHRAELRFGSDGVVIRVPDYLRDEALARISVAHELGHLL